MSADKYKCVVCGRPFPAGQGVVLNIAGVPLAFHSNKCFAKFCRALLEKLPGEEVKGYVKRVADEFEESLEQKAKARSKKII